MNSVKETNLVTLIDAVQRALSRCVNPETYTIIRELYFKLVDERKKSTYLKYGIVLIQLKDTRKYYFNLLEVEERFANQCISFSYELKDFEDLVKLTNDNYSPVFYLGYNYDRFHNVMRLRLKY